MKADKISSFSGLTEITEDCVGIIPRYLDQITSFSSGNTIISINGAGSCLKSDSKKDFRGVCVRKVSIA